MAKKRAREAAPGGAAAAPSLKSKKRQRVEGAASTSTSTSTAGSKSSKFVSLGDLDWKAVELPDRWDDAEGFFGLEEIDGVEILRDQEKGGEVKFMAAGNKLKKKTTDDDEDHEEDGEEWGGFTDDEEPTVNSEPAANVDSVEEEKNKTTKKDNKKEPKQKADKPAPKDRNKQAPSKNGIQAGISFAALEGQDEEDEEIDISAWDPLNLSPELQTGLAKLKFATPTPIQSSCIPLIAAGHDVVGKASTGSGKTLAFGIPILEHYLQSGRGGDDLVSSNGAKSTESGPIALILSPTRELAHQIAKHIGELSASAPQVNARVALLTGGLSVQKQQRLLAAADIVIGTPGRTWDVLSSGHGLIRKMGNIKFLVIDEADRLLSEGQFKEVEEIIGALDRKETDDDDEEPDDSASQSDSEDDANSQRNQRQTLVFSATFHKGLQQKLAGKGQFFDGDLLDNSQSMEYLLKKLNFREEKPKFVDVNPVSQMADNLKEGLLECGAMEKDLYLYTTLLYHPKHRTLVFTNSISAVRRLTSLLQTLQLPALGLHSSMAQKARLRSVERFSSPSSDPSSILVATDVAARGLDIKGIDLIIHYHVPRTADVYVHRSGRTARAHASGKSILICAPEEIVGVARLAAKVHVRNTSSSAPQKRLQLETVDLDRRIVARIKPRVSLAKTITESTLAKEKISSEGDWLRTAADDLGVDYDSEEFAAQSSRAKGRGRGGGREARVKLVGSMTKAEISALRAQLRDLLSKKINVGVSEKYLTAGRVDIEALLRGEGNQSFLGHVEKLGF
ncbi:hypothetical protein AJ80_00583 [Polytolypa hystricis UAMH7299]|uniref:ATP-dependent RNA helicase n=1 Tax=Polytolypa hystricis (strain UAMH7299) TaxID=1447883 RepID=A0A2B7Z2F4_POLH7|nr:hypothetical protein AJ80_00583 [Polytolypa hystricis UAMH7299]